MCAWSIQKYFKGVCQAQLEFQYDDENLCVQLHFQKGCVRHCLSMSMIMYFNFVSFMHSVWFVQHSFYSDFTFFYLYSCDSSIP